MLIYKITDVEDRAGNKKAIPQEWIEADYVLSKATIGHSAILPHADGEKYLRTSKVESIDIWDNTVVLTTRNTVYRFKPVVD